MSSYSAAQEDIATVTGDTILSISSDGTVRPKINNIILSSGATPDDQACNFEVIRATTVGTGTAITPVPLDPNSPAASASAKHTLTVEPTEVGNSTMLALSLNQRASFSWLANPGSEFIVVPTSGYSIGIMARSYTTSYVVDATMIFEE